MTTFHFGGRPLTRPSTVTLTLTYSSAAAASAAAVGPADFKYNKSSCLQIDNDDGGLVAYSFLFPYLQGLTYTDGTGNAVSWRGNLAINGQNLNTGHEIGDGADTSKYTYAQMQLMLQAGWDLSNHSMYHANGPDFTAQTNDLQALILARLGYTLRTGVVPTNYAGFIDPFFNAGCLVVSSQGTTTGSYPLLPPYTNTPVLLAGIPPGPTTRYVLRRTLLDAATSSLVSTEQGKLDTLLGASGSNKYVYRVFSHTDAPADNFQAILNYAYTRAGDRLWVPSLREWAEYFETKRLTVISQAVSGSTVTVTLDQRALPVVCRWRDLSLLVGPGLVSASATGAASVSCNPATGLVNVYVRPLASYV